MSTLSNNLEKLRKQLGFSQETVAGYLNVSHTILSNYEKDKYDPTHSHLKQLADLYGVDIADLFEENPAHQVANAAFAFRADGLKQEDLSAIAQFRLIVKNYITLHEVK